MRAMQGTKKKGNLINGRDIAMQIAIFLFYVCAFSVILTSGLSADDMWNSNIQAASYLGGPGPVKVMLGQWKIGWKPGGYFRFQIMRHYYLRQSRLSRHTRDVLSL